MSECHGIKRAYQHPDVCIGWYPMRTTEPTVIMTDPVNGTVIKELIQHAGVGRQSVRNPAALPEPEPRLAVSGPNGKRYLWCYSRAGSYTGWIDAALLEKDPDAASKSVLLGPGGFDFEVGRPRDNGWVGPLPKRASGCGEVSKTQPLRRVKARDTYLRYSPRGTAFHYLHKGDVIKLLIVDGPHGFGFGEIVSVAEGSLLKVGTRGWVTQISLEPVT